MTRVLQRLMYKTQVPSHCFQLQFGPFNSTTQRRWKKPVVTAQTRLEDRTRDLKLDYLMTNFRKISLILILRDLMCARRRGPFVSVQIMSRWNNIVGLNVPIGGFLRKYPHVFDVFTHPIKRNICCKLTSKMTMLLQEESNVIRDMELDNVRRIKKLLMISVTGTLHIHALRLIRRELGLPEDFRESILAKYSSEFELVDLEIVKLINRDGVDEGLKVAEVEKWREREYREKWLSEFETKYAFPINFPTGFKIIAGFKGKLKDWQRLPYVKPYERKEVFRASTCGGIEQFEKRAVGILHELLSLTVEKMVEVERLAHFRRDFGIPVNLRELILKHPGIFYISTRGSTQMLFLREAYRKDYLVSPNPVYVVRRKMLDLILLGCRSTRELDSPRQVKESVGDQNRGAVVESDFVTSILENLDDNNDGNKENGEDTAAVYREEASAT
ncbi:protein ROOT PRIMORDIUM DEFECTIVE 1-like [Cynara cardunculus var. scolymus]|nr:protein ROOT PRIMORDIUM DEFECTIVE 1-like [Cynara cardunculus var. scolymus]XP_024975215.1 protein ROOT PRIMORDIUM DEFECTIVE 1-like [Cynara cardunculus var. scolymus]XP_024975216.1 protein ROOT PRIMORDIUM DEFECTIVE 1-like [Cynara cardunculus var. scolymus]